MVDFDEEKQNKQLEDIHKEEEEQLVQMLAESKYKLPYVNLSRIGIDNEALRAITEKDAREMVIGPFKLSGKNISIAVRSPSEGLLSKLKDQIEIINKKNIITTGWPTESCLNKDYNTYNSWFQNFIVSFPNFSEQFKIISLDWVSRGTALPEPGL